MFPNLRPHLSKQSTKNKIIVSWDSCWSAAQRFTQHTMSFTDSAHWSLPGPSTSTSTFAGRSGTAGRCDYGGSMERWSERTLGTSKKVNIQLFSHQPSSLLAPRRRMKRKQCAPLASSFMAPDSWTGAFSSLSDIKHLRMRYHKVPSRYWMILFSNCYQRTIASMAEL